MHQYTWLVIITKELKVVNFLEINAAAHKLVSAKESWFVA